MNDPTPSPIRDPQVKAVLEGLQARRKPHISGTRLVIPTRAGDPFQYYYGVSIVPDQGDLIHLLCRGLRTQRVAEFRDFHWHVDHLFCSCRPRQRRREGDWFRARSSKGSGSASQSRRRRAAEYAEIREGDARETLQDLGAPVDFVLIDGWPVSQGPSLARQVIEIVAPQIRIGGYVMNDNAEPDFLDFIRNPSSGFLRDSAARRWDRVAR
jgi:hypothetical protein